MIFKVYAVKDELTGRFMEPQFYRSDDEALRNFQYQINNIPIWKDNSSDYSLYRLGEFSEEDGFVKNTFDTLPNKLSGGRSLLKGE